jgi:hypothetical protein
MKRLHLIVLFLLLIGGSLQGFCGGPASFSAYNQLFSQEKYAGLHTAAREFYLSEEEKLVVALCNLVRYDPAGFVREVLTPAGIDSGRAEYNEMFSFLSQRKSVFPLMPAFSLYKSAVLHARDMGLNGLSGHKSSDGKTFPERIGQYFPTQTGFAENYYQGSGDPLDLVLSFLMAKGENGRQYRENLLSPGLHYIGVSILPHRSSCNNAVLDFAQKPQVAATQGHRRKEIDVYWRDCPKGSKVATRRKAGSFWFSGLFGSRRR